MPSSRSLRPSSILLACLLTVTAAGCGAPSNSASVSGAVTINGKPPKSKVLLSFVGVDNVPRSVRTDDAGTFSLSDLPVGEVKVMISQSASDARAGSDQPGSARKGEGKGSAGPRSPPQATRSEIPAEYSDAGNPRLRYTLGPGHTPLTIDLKAPAK
jgi:hypothetical protein